jgi:hypothetical protein
LDLKKKKEKKIVYTNTDRHTVEDRLSGRQIRQTSRQEKTGFQVGRSGRKGKTGCQVDRSDRQADKVRPVAR